MYCYGVWVGWVSTIALPVRRWACWCLVFFFFLALLGEAPKGRETRGKGEASILSCLYCLGICLSDACIINTLDLLLCFQDKPSGLSDLA